ncbi:hypothetical protein [Clostridium frigidicarnis]|uniref:Uncharacterized protein n=1 Tax=Clostridium frigidicarnis TaxID=84698 RepID=A0A1I0ZYT6_9CLOT|nr:hypothetical protein [Clostridium frigidicarnis]SFB29283.1 hypothetical protein SAMN04488528_102535 [Clostridium frigidicarnis]
MVIKKKNVIHAIILIFITWCGNIIYYVNTEIDKPLFLKNYKEVSDNGMFQLYNIDNSYKSNEMLYVIFPEIQSKPAYITNNENFSNNHYRLNNFNIDLRNIKTQNNEMLYDELKDKSFVITKMIYGDIYGEEHEVDLGEIHLLKRKEEKKHQYDLYKRVGTQSTSDKKRGVLFRAWDNISIDKVESNFYDQIKNKFEISINNVPLDEIKVPLKINRYDDIYVESTDNTNETHDYSFEIKLNISDPEGSMDCIKFNVGNQILYKDKILSSKFIKQLKNEGV